MSAMPAGVMLIDEVREYLPHRFPFLLVDRVLELEVGQRILALKNVSVNEPQFTGHFPERPVFPGVYAIEAMAQAAGILAFKTVGAKPQPDSSYYLAGVDKARFKRVIVPGDAVHLEARLVRSKRTIWVFDCQARVAGELCASAELMCMVQLNAGA